MKGHEGVLNETHSTRYREACVYGFFSRVYRRRSTRSKLRRKRSVLSDDSSDYAAHAIRLIRICKYLYVDFAAAMSIEFHKYTRNVLAGNIKRN